MSNNTPIKQPPSKPQTKIECITIDDTPPIKQPPSKPKAKIECITIDDTPKKRGGSVEGGKLFTKPSTSTKSTNPHLPPPNLPPPKGNYWSNKPSASTKSNKSKVGGDFESIDVENSMDDY